MKARIKKLSGLFISQTARHTYAVFTGNLASAFFAFVFTVILVRILTISDFGYFSALLSLMMLVSELSDIGIGQSLSSFLPVMEETPEKLKSFLKASFIVQFSIASIVTTIIILFAGVISQLLFHTLRFRPLVILTAVSIFATVIGVFINNALSARRKFYRVSFLNALGSFIRLLFLLILIFFSLVSLNSTVLVQTLSIVAIMLIAAPFLNFDFFKSPLKNTDFKKLISFAYLLGIARAFTAIAFRLDVLMLVSIKNATEAGIYSTASRVISIYPLLNGSFLTVIAPKMASITEKSQLDSFLKKIIFGVAGLVFSTFFMMLVADPFMVTLFGQKAIPAVPVFRLLLLSMAGFVASAPAVSLSVYYLKKPHIITINSILQLIIVFIGNLFFIPRYGRFGPAISLTLAYGTTFILTTLLTWYYYKKRHQPVLDTSPLN